MRDRQSDSAHRTPVEVRLGRKLLPTEVVDHVDQDKDNNTPANLRPMDRGEHTGRHNDPAVRVHGRVVKALTMPRRGEKLY